MIREILNYILTPATREARKLGYLYSSIAMEQRYRRCESAWQPHILKARHFVQSHLPKNARRILILGSGLMVELPIEVLLSEAQCLKLVDMVFPRSVRTLARQNKNVSLSSWDVTGFADWFLKNPGQTEKLNFSPPTLDAQYDCIISANLLSQLPLEPLQALAKAASGPRADLGQRLTQKIQTDHWNWLAAQSGRKILFSDFKRKYVSPSGELLQSVSSAHLSPEWQKLTDWEWQISPLGEESKDYSMSMTVAGFCRD